MKFLHVREQAIDGKAVVHNAVLDLSMTLRDFGEMLLKNRKLEGSVMEVALNFVARSDAIKALDGCKAGLEGDAHTKECDFYTEGYPIDMDDPNFFGDECHAQYHM